MNDDRETTVCMNHAEAHRRIEEAEKGIARGEVVLHQDVMRHSYELLAPLYASNSTGCR